MSKQVMQQGLDALEYHTAQTRPIAQTERAIEALRIAIAAPEPEPVGHIYTIAGVQHCTITASLDDCALYTTPPDTESLRKELERVKGERDAMAVDAKRYRWLRDTESFDFSACKGDLPTGAEFDALMDAAIAAQGEGA